MDDDDGYNDDDREGDSGKHHPPLGFLEDSGPCIMGGTHPLITRSHPLPLLYRVTTPQ